MSSDGLPKISNAIVQHGSTGRRKVLSGLTRGPRGMAGEEPVDKTHFVNDEQAKDEAYHATRGGEEAVHPGEAVPGHSERHGDRGGNQHHAGNGTDPENQQVRDREGRNANRGEHEERNRGGPSEAVNDANHERTKQLIKSDAAKRAV